MSAPTPRLCGFALLLLAVAAAAEPCPPSRVLRDGDGPGSSPSITSDAKYTYALRFPGKTVSSAAATCYDRGRPRGDAVDATPAGIIASGPTGSGSDLTFTLYPDNGVSAGARAGHQYQCDFLVTTSDAAYKPKVSVCVTVRDNVWQP